MINIEPLHLAMTAQQVIAASEDTVYVWSYRQILTKAQGEGRAVGILSSKEPA